MTTSSVFVSSLKSLYSLAPSLDVQRLCCISGIRFATSESNVLPSTRYENEKRQECNRLVLAREQKQSVVDTYRTHATDTGSPEVQIALLSERIGQLTEHFKAHQKDHGSRRGLLMMVSRRRSLLDYLKKYDSERYKTVISKLGIRK
jgi:small subunit ribosomal protein S15